MFKEIRKKKNIITLEEIKEVLKKARRGVLSINDEEYPYSIPINFYYDDNKEAIYFHSSRIGTKVDLLNKDNKVCFVAIGKEIIKDLSWAPYVESVVAFGRCNLIKDMDETLQALKKFAMKYYPTEEMVDEEIKVGSIGVTMYKIEIEHKSGKIVQEK